MKNKIITSNLEYFKSILEKHKTFGNLFNLNDKNAFLKVIEESCTKGYMVISKKDIEEYNNQKEFKIFISKIKKLVI